MIYTFKIQLRYIKKPTVWRRLEVSSTITFSQFHQILQIAFEWGGYHLYAFREQPYGGQLSIEHQGEAASMCKLLEADDVRLEEIFSSIDKFVYLYDFGDDWVHDITLEKTTDGALLYPKCLAGNGACPPEDCGGPIGYEIMKAEDADDPVMMEELKYFDKGSLNEELLNIML